ncbi:MAG: hypothetical protein LC624_05455 [Halobacteriales archaeon]|nr:hypothetical protein [Halobacteriales archaeon]
MPRTAWFAIAGMALVALAAPLAAAEEVLAACLTSDELAPLAIPEGQQDVDTGKVLPQGGVSPPQNVRVTASEGKRGLNAVNVKKA